MQKYTGVYKKGNRYFVRFNYNHHTYTAGKGFRTRTEAFERILDKCQPVKPRPLMLIHFINSIPRVIADSIGVESLHRAPGRAVVRRA